MNDVGRPYPPSWYDRLQDWIEVRTGSAWVPYVVAGLAIGVLLNLTAWLTGYVRFWIFDPFINSAGPYVVLGFAGMHVLDDAAGRAWAAVRPMTRLDDDAADRFAYELTTLPARPALAATALSVIVSATFLASQYGRPFDLEEEPFYFVISAITVTIGFAGTTGMFYHALHQLRTIGRVHRFFDRIDPLYLGPIYSFAGVTAGTGIVLLAIGYLALPTVPSPFGNPAVVVFTIASSMLAIACFVVPLMGMHDAIAAEKARRMAVVNRLLADGLGELHRRAEAGDLTDADALNKQLSSLQAERELIERAPTWPWAPQTVRGFSAAVVIPILLWRVYRFLEQAV